jgi:hypothetical protein
MNVYGRGTGKAIETYYLALRHILGEYATTNVYEELAEVFTLVTSPNYQRGMLPKAFEEVVGMMLREDVDATLAVDGDDDHNDTGDVSGCSHQDECREAIKEGDED